MFSTNHEWSSPRVGDVLQRAERVEAGEQRRGQPVPVGVEPQAARAGEDADAVLRPDGRVVGDALGVVPHAVLVHHRGARRLRGGDAGAVTWSGTPDSIRAGSRPADGGPVGADQVMVGADPAGRDDDRLADSSNGSCTARGAGRRALAGVGDQHVARGPR